MNIRKRLITCAGIAGTPLKDVSILARLYPLRVGVLARNDSNINTFDDLKGKKLTYGYVSQTTIKNILTACLRQVASAPMT